MTLGTALRNRKKMGWALAAGAAAAQWPVGGLWAVLVPNLLNAVVGIVAGGLVLAGVTLVQRLRGKSTA